MTRAIVVGHRGFVGSAVAEHLRSISVEVVGVDRNNYAELRGSRADVLINASGSSDRRLAATDPVASFKQNVDATMSTVFDFDYDRYVLISSVCVYDRPEDPACTTEGIEISAERLPRYGLYKLIAELIVRRHARRWLIARLGGLVGPGLRKNPVFDLLTKGTLYVHPESTSSYVDTRDVARIVWSLREEEGQVYNVCGPDTVTLADVARELGVALGTDLYRLPCEDVRQNAEKLMRRVRLDDSHTSVARFAREWRDGAR